jgi:hypothetical protein
MARIILPQILACCREANAILKARREALALAALTGARHHYPRLHLP